MNTKEVFAKISATLIRLTKELAGPIFKIILALGVAAAFFMSAFKPRTNCRTILPNNFVRPGIKITACTRHAQNASAGSQVLPRS